jgi:threonine/homoserine/homoserine lactone efflux protein
MPVDLATFVLIALLLTITPGVDTVLVLRSSIARGTPGGLASAAGICSGLLVHALLSSVGLTVILSQSATAYHAVRLAGAAYLLWLGGRILWQSRPRRDAQPAPPDDLRDSGESDDSGDPGSVLTAVGAPSPTAPRGFVAAFFEGLANNLLNPKVVLFYLAVVPQFVPQGGSIVATSLLLGGIHALMGIAWLGLVAAAAGRARRWFARPGVRAWLDRCAGTVLLAFGTRVALSD